MDGGGREYDEKTSEKNLKVGAGRGNERLDQDMGNDVAAGKLAQPARLVYTTLPGSHHPPGPLLSTALSSSAWTITIITLSKLQESRLQS